MTRPNIVCVSVDSLRADFTSIYDYTDASTTPFLESLADESTIYRAAISPSTWTLPVHTSIFTGLYPPEHDVVTGKDVLGDRPTFAELLADQGYSTYAYHKNGWLNAGDILRGFATPMQESEQTTAENQKTTKKAFAERLGSVVPEVEEALTRSWRAYVGMKEKFEPVSDAIDLYREWGFPGETTVDQRWGTKTVDRLTESAENTEQPFCWLVHFNDAHWKYRPPNPYHRLFTERDPSGLVYNHSWWQRRVYENRTQRLKTTAGKIHPPEREVATFQDLYRGAISFCDDLLKRVVRYLKDRDVWDNTVLLVFGDHGDQFGEAGVFDHNFSIHDSILRVPLLVRDPTGRIGSGTVSTPVSLLDIYPTVLELAGVSPPETEAVSLVDGDREYAYSHYDISEHESYVNAPDRGVRLDELPPAIQVSVWKSESEKLVYYPGEDRYNSSGESTEHLREELREHMNDLNYGESKGGELGEAVTQRLEDIGYL